MRKFSSIGLENELDFPEGLTEELRNLVQQERDETVMSMPTERVMRALRANQTWQRENVISLELLSWFRPVMWAGSLAIVLLLAYNAKLSSSSE